MIIEPVKWDDESFGGYLSNKTKHFKYLIHQQSQTDSLKCPTGIGQRLKICCAHIWYGEQYAICRIPYKYAAHDWLLRKGEATGILVCAEESEKSYKEDNNSKIYAAHTAGKEIYWVQQRYMLHSNVFFFHYILIDVGVFTQKQSIYHSKDVHYLKHYWNSAMVEKLRKLQITWLTKR